LINGYNADYVIAAKGYDSNEFIETIETFGMTAVIPLRSYRNEPLVYDKEI